MSKISIITVSYNSAKTISETIESVLSQDYPEKEYLIIDGQSSDGTQDIVKSYGENINVFLSERDKGLYDAMNKGIDLSSGSVVGIINSDDLYVNNTVLSEVMRLFNEDNSLMCVFADLYYFNTDEPEKPVRFYRGNLFRAGSVRYGIVPPHPTFFVRKSAYEKFGKFDLQFKYCGDFDLIARFLEVHKLPYKYLSKVIVKMRMGGLSTSGFKRMIEMNNEDLRSCKLNGIKTNYLLFYSKYLLKIYYGWIRK